VKKKILLAISAALVFAVSFGVSTYAAYVDRCWYCGYFSNSYDSSGDDVIQNNANDGWGHYNGSTGGYDSIPPGVNSANLFISFIEGKLNSTRIDYGTANNATNWDRTAAAYIIDTMMDQRRSRPPNGAEVADWEARVRHAEQLGHINWGTYVSAYPNTFYQISRWDGSSYLNDVAWYPATGSGTGIVFYKDDGSVGYILRRACANPIGDLGGLTQATWAATGATLVTDDDGAAAGDTGTEISVRPGAAVRFRSTVTNNGPANSCNWYHIMGRNGGTVASTPWTGQYYSNVSLSGSPTFTRTDTNLAFDWGLGGPGGGVPVDNFSARWTKTENFAAGSYWFSIVGDDGVRLYIDGVLRLDAWVAQGATSYHYNINLAAGNHTIQMDYFESGGPGYSRLDYVKDVYVGGTDSGCYSVGQTKTLEDTTVNVPGNAAAGTQICRRILWDWKNSWGGGEYGIGTAGWGYTACATVTGSYTLTPSVVPSTTLAQQGDTVTFTYNVNNSGTIDATSIGCSISGTQPAGTQVPPATNCPRTFTAGTTSQATNVVESLTIGSQPAGSKICRTLTVNPGSSGGGSVSSTQACVLIGKKPYVHFMGSDVWAGGGILSGGTCTTNANAKITTSSQQFNNAATGSFTGQYYNNMTLSGSPVLTRTDPAINFLWNVGSPGAGVPADLFSARWTMTQNFPAGTYTFSGNSDDGVRVYVDGNLVVNQWVNQSFAPYGGSATLTAGNHTVVVEYFENGGEANITFGISSSTVGAGSVSEYGAFALSDVTKFGSGGKPLFNSSDFADLGRRLVFANNTSTIGRFGAPQHCINDYSAQFDSLPVGGALAITSTTSGAWHSASFPSLSGTAPAGVTKVYYSDADVTITGDIKYPDTYNSISDIPSIVVIAKGNIYVNPGVTRMDGIYITRGTFFTCYPKPSPPSNSTCATQLTINGSVIANTLDLYRTFGGDGATAAARQTPAEIFNFSTELFLRNVLNNTTGGSVSTSDSRELPPRF
jgi:uncharacterized repeat protein (TIGR01451 family)